MESISIDSYQHEDFSAVVELLKRANMFYPPADTEEVYAQQLKKDPESMIVARQGNAVVGFVMALYDPWASTINHLVVDPVYRGRDLGKRLMDAAEKTLFDKGTAQIRLFVKPGNEEVITFYKHIGY